MKASICIATYNKYSYMQRVLSSIFRQNVPVQVIVADDGSTDETSNLADQFPIHYVRVERGEMNWRNPSLARNVALKEAECDIVIMQSDDVVHEGNAIENLLNIPDDHFCIATVLNQLEDGTVNAQYTGLQHQRPFFFLGSVLRRHICTIGGNDEDFVEPGYDDDWLGMCLTRGVPLHAYYRSDVVGYHLDHIRVHAVSEHSRREYEQKLAAAERGIGKFQAYGGPWPFKSGISVRAMGF